MGTLAMSMAGNRPRKMWLMTMLVPCCLCHSPLGLAADDAASLRDEHQSLTQQSNHNQFQRPLCLTSAESPFTQRGDIYAVVDYPFAIVNSALNNPALGQANWCEVLMLHLYTRYCHAPADSNGSVLRVNMGKTVEEDLEPYLAAIASQLDPPAREALASIEGAGRQMLAARSYLLRAGRSAGHWSWTQTQIEAYEGSCAQQHLDAEINRVRQSFEERNPGFTLFVNPQVRSLEAQIEHWNTNASVAEGADELVAAANALLVAGGVPEAGTPEGRDAFSRFLASYSPKFRSTIAAPGLSSHGQMRAVDFQVRKDGETVAGPDTTTIESAWIGGGWRDKLKAAVVASGARFVGPLKDPDEPWHYDYLSELDVSDHCSGDWGRR